MPANPPKSAGVSTPVAALPAVEDSTGPHIPIAPALGEGVGWVLEQDYRRRDQEAAKPYNVDLPPITGSTPTVLPFANPDTTSISIPASLFVTNPSKSGDNS